MRNEKLFPYAAYLTFFSGLEHDFSFLISHFSLFIRTFAAEI